MFVSVILLVKLLKSKPSSDLLYSPLPTSFRTTALLNSSGHHYAGLYVNSASGVEVYSTVVLLFASHSSKCQEYVDLTLLSLVSLYFIFLVSPGKSFHFFLLENTETHIDMYTHIYIHCWLNVFHP